MSNDPPVIDYATPPPRRRTPWWVWPVVRELIALNLSACIVVAAISAAATAATFFLTDPTVTVFGRSIETVPARIAWIALCLVLATAGVFAVLWHAKQWDAQVASVRGPKSS